MPDVAFFPDPPKVPVVDTALAWPAVLLVAATCAVVLPVAVVVSGLAVARRAHLERAGEAT